MRWVALALCAACAVAVGCRSSCDRVESELRAREEDVRTLKEEVERLACSARGLEHELAASRGHPGPDGLIHPPSDPYPVRALVIGRGTGGRVADGCEDGLTVFVEPRDCEDQAIKAPGSLTVELLERPEEGEKRLLKRWEVPPDELRCTWQSGLFSTGYKLSLDLGTRPSTERLRVVARFRMSNGRVFEADRDIVVKLPPRPAAPARPAAVVPPSVSPPLVPPSPPSAPTEPPAEKLPPPTPLNDPVPEKPAPEKPAPEKPAPEKPLEGPVLTRTRCAKPIAELLPPVPPRDE